MSALPLRGRLAQAARVGHPYDAALEVPAPFRAERAEGHEPSGLAFDAGTARFHGTPVAPGEFAVSVHGWSGEAPAMVTLALPVSPDPWSLWQDIPSDPTAPFARPDTDCAGLAGDLELVMASRRGRKHAHAGRHREDAAGIAVHGRWHLGAVADGAGSASLSREGARIAVETVLAVLPDALEAGSEAALPQAARAAIRGIEAAAAAEARPVADFATTLVLGAARATAQGWEVACLSVGDGLAAVWDGTRIVPMMRPDGGEFAGQTRFLDAAALDGPSRVILAEIPRLSGLLMMTDGVSDARFPSPRDEADPASWAALWAEIGALGPEALLEWLNFRVQGEHDDRSIVLMRPAP